jgi:hypothetical protein
MLLKSANPAVSGVGEDKARQRDNFHKNVVGSRLYYGDMLGEVGLCASRIQSTYSA